jgi:hypothetical protein
MYIRVRSNRLNAALALRAVSLVDFARRIGASRTHLRQVMSSQRAASARLVDELKAELGEAWFFVVGETDVLVDRTVNS